MKALHSRDHASSFLRAGEGAPDVWTSTCPASDAHGLAPPRPIYLDHHATTPMDPRVITVVRRVMEECFGNPNSVDHVFGDRAAALLSEAREHVSALVGAEPEHVRFTSGATEAIRIALSIAEEAVQGRPIRVAATRVEHHAVLDALGYWERRGRAQVVWINVDERARVELSAIAAAVAEGADLLCLMAANNEVGTIYPIEDAAAIARRAGAAILVDATQAASAGSLRAADWGIDYLALSAHKLYGPKGAGALVGPLACSEAAELAAGHSGTPNSPALAGFGEASRLALLERDRDQIRLCELRDRLEAALLSSVPRLVVNGDRANRLAGNLHISAPGVPNGAVIARVRRDVAVSTGSACSSGSDAPSHVLRAMRLPADIQDSALRVSVGKFTTTDEVDRAAALLAAAIADVRTAMGMRA